MLIEREGTSPAWGGPGRTASPI